MSIRLVSICVYARHCSGIRRLVFNTHGLSIVTGRSQRGKSALLDIVDYCLLSKHCRIPKGRIRDAASRVGVLFQDDLGRKIAIIRTVPDDAVATATDVFLEHGLQDLPEVAPDPNYNLDVAKEVLSEFIGIDALPVLTNDRDAEFERQHPANIRHCAPYLFQPQDVVASRAVLFPGLDDFFLRRHVADAADYFLGVLTVDRLALRRELHELTAQRNAARREETERERITARGWERGLALWSECASVGLAGSEPPSSNDQLFSGLHKVSRLVISSPQSATSLPRLDEMQAREAQLRQSLRSLKAEILEIDRLTSSRDDFQAASDGLLARLQVRSLLPESHVHACPLCHSGNVDVAEIERTIEEGVLSIKDSQVVPVRLIARLESRRAELKAEVSALDAQHKSVQSELQQLFLVHTAQYNMIEELQRRARIVGKVQEYISAIGSAPRQIDSMSMLERRIAELNNLVGDVALKKLREETRARLGQIVTDLARELDVEFAGHAVRLSFESFSVEIQVGKAWVRLNEIGSGANWVGYHLAAVVGLQEMFVTNNRPVPAFLMIDQPSQAWFPAEVAEATGAVIPQKDADLNSVRRVFDFLARHSSTAAKPQIIVVDHARLDEPSFANSVVEDWHQDDGLIPRSWPSENS